MTDERSGRELTPREPGPEGGDSAITPVPEPDSRAVERFSAGQRAHQVGLTEERSAQIVRQTGNARNLVFLAVLVVSLFIPVYWFYENRIPAVGAEGRLAREKDVQYVIDVERGHELYLANCAQCHSSEEDPSDGRGGVGPPLNDQAKLYNAVTEDGEPGSGHLNPNYINTVLTVGGRYVCGDPNSVMQAWREPNGPLNYRQIEELIAWITASDDIVFEPAAGHGAEASPMADAEGHSGSVTVRGWRDPEWTPAPGATPPPACWRPYENAAFATTDEGSSGSTAEVTTPGTEAEPRVIAIEATASLTFTGAGGTPLSSITVVPGETVAIQVENVAGFDHNFYVGSEDELSVPNATTNVGIPTFTEGVQEVTWTVPDDASALMFGCTVPGHFPTMHGDVAFQEASGPDGDDAPASPGADAVASPAASEAPAASAATSPAPSAEAPA